MPRRPISPISFISFISLFILTSCSSRPSPLLHPNGVALLPDGGLMIMDRGNYRVVHTSADGKFIGSFGSFGDQPDQIYLGWDMAVDASGNVYFCNLVGDVTTSGHDEVKVFSYAGQFLHDIGRRDYVPESDFAYDPYGLDLDNAGRIYVADLSADGVRVFNPNGDLLAEWFGENGDGEGEFDGLNDVAVDDTRGLLYAVDIYNSRVQQFQLGDANGKPTVAYLNEVGEFGHDPAEFAYPQNIAVDDQSGHIYVGDIGNRRVQVFDADLNYVGEIDTPADLHDWEPMGMTVGPDSALYVADALNNAVWVFEPTGQLRQRIGEWP